MRKLSLVSLRAFLARSWPKPRAYIVVARRHCLPISNNDAENSIFHLSLGKPLLNSIYDGSYFFEAQVNLPP